MYQGRYQCLNANHFTTPPYGPVPDAVAKLRRDANNLIDALVIAIAAEERGVIMPPIPEPPKMNPCQRVRHMPCMPKKPPACETSPHHQTRGH